MRRWARSCARNWAGKAAHRPAVSPASRGAPALPFPPNGGCALCFGRRTHAARAPFSACVPGNEFVDEGLRIVERQQGGNGLNAQGPLAEEADDEARALEMRKELLHDAPVSGIGLQHDGVQQALRGERSAVRFQQALKDDALARGRRAHEDEALGVLIEQVAAVQTADVAEARQHVRRIRGAHRESRERAWVRGKGR